ncbi:MAG: endonuclease MutS2 [Terriglobales bacterium]
MTSSDRALAAGVVAPDGEAVLALLAAYLPSVLGQEALEELRFSRDREELERQHERWQQAQRWRQSGGGSGLGAIADPRPLIEQAQMPNAALDGRELLSLAAFAESVATLRSSLLPDEAVAWPLLAQWGQTLPNLTPLAQAVRRAVLPSGELADDASPELARLRRQCSRQRSLIEAELAREQQRLGASGGGALQEDIITLRHERFVLPVKAEARRLAAGVVHGASSSGQTLFIEPLVTIELNNEHIRLRDGEQAEQFRILHELSSQAAGAAVELSAAARLWGAFELEAAKARFADDYGACAAVFGPDLHLEQLRHPLLVAALRSRPGRVVVPLTLRLGQERMLIVSGPNTGGKTVVLKSVAVAAWMAQCGLPVCAREAHLPILDALWADIGDVQSIQQDLSTFSSHLVHIREILAAATAASMVALDELGTATNAAEGAALAVAIADCLRELGCWTLISTHHDDLKAWASAHAGSVVNGSMAFDAATLAPSYQFRLGVPGVSAGLDMAERLGLPAPILRSARGRLSQEQRLTADYLQQLQEKLAAAEGQLQDLAARDRAVSARAGAGGARPDLAAEADRRLAGGI